MKKKQNVSSPILPRRKKQWKGRFDFDKYGGHAFLEEKVDLIPYNIYKIQVLTNYNKLIPHVPTYIQF